VQDLSLRACWSNRIVTISVMNSVPWRRMLLELSAFGSRNYIFITPSRCMWRGINLV